MLNIYYYPRLLYCYQEWRFQITNVTFSQNSCLNSDVRLEFFSMGSKGGAVVRALASHQCGPGSNPGVDTMCGLSLLLVLSFAPRGFSPGTPVFSSPQKPTFPNSNSTRNQVDEEPLCGCATCKSLFYLFIYLSIYLFSVSPPGLTASRVWDNLYNSKFPTQFCTNLGKKSFFQTWLWPKSLGDVSVGRCFRNVSTSALWLDL